MEFLIVEKRNCPLLRGTYFIVRAAPPSEMYGHVTVVGYVPDYRFFPRPDCSVILHITDVTSLQGLLPEGYEKTRQDKLRQEKSRQDRTRRGEKGGDAKRRGMRRVMGGLGKRRN